MAEVAAGYSHRRQRHGDAAQPSSSGRYSSMSIRSLGQLPQDPEYDEGGAAIPDIPIKRRGEGRDPIDLAFAPSRFEDSHISDTISRVHPRPINPNTIPSKSERRAFQAADLPMRGRVKSPEAGQHQERDTHSSSPPRSPYTRSSRSRANSVASSYQTNATSLPALQTKGAQDDDGLEPLAEEEVESGSFDLVVPSTDDGERYSIEARSELLFSKEHLKAIFHDYLLLQRFTEFLCTVRPSSLPLLTYYLDSLKALRAVAYANAVAADLEAVDDHEFTVEAATPTSNSSLAAKADAAFEALARDDLPAYITHTWIQIVSQSIKKRIMGTLPTQLRDLSEGLAEVFCLTDPSRRDNPIVFASEEFHRTTQYGMNYVIGRNCRFLQGPKTNPFSVKRLRDMIAAGKEHYETFLNYRRDGSPFMNLLMVAPLYDSRGTIRYFIGAQVDVSGLAKDGTGLDALQKLVTTQDDYRQNDVTEGEAGEEEDQFRDLSEMFNLGELETVRRRGGNMHRVRQHLDDKQPSGSSNWQKPRILIQEESSSIKNGMSMQLPSSGKLSGVYEHYLLVRPYPSLRVLFASPSLRVPGMLQSHFMSKIGGSNRVRDGLTQAFAEGQGVTAKVRWISKTGGEGRPRWIHCTPLLGSNNAVGVWMVVIVDDEADAPSRRSRDAPPVDPRLRRVAAPHQLASPKDDTMSLSSFAAINKAHDETDLLGADYHGEGMFGRREGSSMPLSVGADDDNDRPGTPYTMRLDDD